IVPGVVFVSENLPALVEGAELTFCQSVRNLSYAGPERQLPEAYLGRCIPDLLIRDLYGGYFLRLRSLPAFEQSFYAEPHLFPPFCAQYVKTPRSGALVTWAYGRASSTVMDATRAMNGSVFLDFVSILAYTKLPMSAS